MDILDLEQGSEDWLKAREKYYTASEADAMMGTSKYKTRFDLLHEKKTGIKPEFNDYMKGIFERGHELEALARAKHEAEFFGFPLEPVVGVRANLLASFDGYNKENQVIWEHKTWSKYLSEFVSLGIVPESHKWQLVQQCFISNIDECYFVISNEDNFECCIFVPTRDDYRQLTHGWMDFMDELKFYKPTENTDEPILKEDLVESKNKMVTKAMDRLIPKLEAMQLLYTQQFMDEAMDLIKRKRTIDASQRAVDGLLANYRKRAENLLES